MSELKKRDNSSIEEPEQFSSNINTQRYTNKFQQKKKGNQPPNRNNQTEHSEEIKFDQEFCCSVCLFLLSMCCCCYCCPLLLYYYMKNKSSKRYEIKFFVTLSLIGMILWVVFLIILFIIVLIGGLYLLGLFDPLIEIITSRYYPQQQDKKGFFEWFSSLFFSSK